MEFEVIVQPKKEVLDPEGRAIHTTLARVGYPTLMGVRVSKRYVLSLNPQPGSDPLVEAQQIAARHLANPVAETYTVQRLKNNASSL